jgi:hypothetical protein
MEFIFLIGLAYLTAYVAQKKGRNFFGWFAIGLLTGGIGVIIALILPPKNL